MTFRNPTPRTCAHRTNADLIPDKTTIGLVSVYLILRRQSVSIALRKRTQTLCKRLESALVGVSQSCDKTFNHQIGRDVPLQKRKFCRGFTALIIGAAIVISTPALPFESKEFSYADTADAVSLAPIVAVAIISKAKRLKGDLAVDVPEGRARFLVTARLAALLRSTDSLPERIEYLLDTPLDAKGRGPKLQKNKVILAAAPVSGKPGSVRLTSQHAQMPWSPALETQVRAIVTESVAANKPPVINGVGGAFHVKGSLPGESETQIFLKTAGHDSVSLNILRRPGEDVRWAVALDEMIDDSAKPPTPDTLLWYRLACFLPSELPSTSVASLSAEDAGAAGADYRFVIDALGPCVRTVGK
jgi:hypothetical protein